MDEDSLERFFLDQARLHRLEALGAALGEVGALAAGEHGRALELRRLAGYLLEVAARLETDAAEEAAEQLTARPHPGRGAEDLLR